MKKQTYFFTPSIDGRQFILTDTNGNDYFAPKGSDDTVKKAIREGRGVKVTVEGDEVKTYTTSPDNLTGAPALKDNELSDLKVKKAPVELFTHGNCNILMMMCSSQKRFSFHLMTRHPSSHP